MKFLLSLLQVLVLALLVSCSTTQQVSKEPPPPADKRIQKEYEQARLELIKSPVHGLRHLEAIIQKYPNTSVASNAAKLAGDYYFKNRKYSQALNAYSYILNDNFRDPYKGEVYGRSIKIMLENGQKEKALATLNQALRYDGLTSEEKIDLLSYQLEFQKEAQDVMAQLETLAQMYNLSQSPQAKTGFRIRASTIADSLVRPKDLDAVLSNSNLEFVHANIHYRLGSVAFEQSDFSAARSHFSSVVSLAPESELAESARDFLKQLDARSSVDSRTVGVILPLSGKYGDIGRSVLNSIQLGLGIYNKSSNIKLAVIDSEGRYLDARRAVEKLVVEDQVIAIIGSLQSKAATAIASRAQALGVPSIVLSQKSGITQIGDFVFRNALTSEMQVQSLVQTATQKLNLTRFAILYPDDAYGTEYANLFWDAVEKSGGQIRAAQSYDPKETDFRVAVEKLVGTYYKEDRDQEYKQKLDEWKKKNTKVTARTEVPKDLLPPIVDFQAIFIPDSARTLGQIAAMLTFQDVKNVSLLGTNLWNTPGVVERAGQFANSVIFVDSFLNQDQSFMQSDFYKTYVQNFGHAPSLFDLQAYDTALILKDTLSGASSRTELQAKLSEVRSLKGALNTIDTAPSRDFSRPVVALTVSDGKILRLDQATNSPNEKPSKK